MWSDSFLLNAPNIETLLRLLYNSLLFRIWYFYRWGLDFSFYKITEQSYAPVMEVFITRLSRRNIKSLKLNPEETRVTLALPPDLGCLCCNKWGTRNWELPTASFPRSRVSAHTGICKCFLPLSLITSLWGMLVFTSQHFPGVPGFFALDWWERRWKLFLLLRQEVAGIGGGFIMPCRSYLCSCAFVSCIERGHTGSDLC